jgi:CRISPR-associated protein Csy2
MRRILLLPRIEIHNAIALSSPFTIGFPAMTAWLGAVHALQLKVNNGGFQNVSFKNVAVISHQVDLQVHKGVGDYVYSIIGTGNPLDKDGKRPSFIEEARCHLDASLLIEYSGIGIDDEDTVMELILLNLNSSMKVAGGDILSFKKPEYIKVEDGNDLDLRKLIRKVMPGYAIIERRELMLDAMQNGMDAIDALVDYLAVHHTCEQDDNGNVIWSSQRKTSGWIVPIATGFHGITELGTAKNQRDPDVQHRFAESIVTLGEFKMPHRIKSLDEIFWSYHVDPENRLYLCQQINQPTYNNNY